MVNRILLAENDTELIEGYERDLLKFGFEVESVLDGDLILSRLKRYGRNYVDALVSDTDMIDMDGPVAVGQAIEGKLVDLDRTVVIGMSDVEDNQKYWRGLVNYGCFYNRCRISDNRLGLTVAQCLRNFRVGGIWRERMLILNSD